MMDIWSLPTTLDIDGVEFDIRSDYRDILKIIMAFESPDYTDNEKWQICLRIMFPKWRELPYEKFEEICAKVLEFIDVGAAEDSGGRKKPAVMDWEQDARIIIPSINKVIGHDVRSDAYMHWWTFMAAYMEIGEGVFSQVVSIRDKKTRGKKLEKWEQEFYRDNKKLVDLKKKYTKEELEEQERLKALL